jgi:hypothetical protein
MTGISITASKSPSKVSPWKQFGLLGNPFPPSGVATDVDYDGHQPDQVREIISWLNKSVDPTAEQWSPLAISGSIGVGKTHVLRKMERACADYRESENLGSRLMVSSQTLVGAGMKTLLLSNLLLEALNQPLPSGNVQTNSAEMPLFAMAVEQMLSDKNAQIVLEVLPPSSPIHKPLTRIAAARTTNEASRLTALLSSWLARRNLTTGQLESLGLGGKLEGEGQAVRAFAHVCRFAQKAMGFRVWFLFIDQMEDLWRRDVTTALRRTRFLTDLRTLIDEALEGCPVAVTLAWNTEVLIAGSRIGEDVEERLQRDYLAMFSRISNVVHISTLPREHLLPFASAYVEHASAMFRADKTASKGKEPADAGKFERLLEKEFSSIESRIEDWGRRPNDGSVVARAWLDALRDWADNLVAPTA